MKLTKKDLDHLIVLAQKKFPGWTFKRLQDRANSRADNMKKEFGFTEDDVLVKTFRLLAKRLEQRQEQ